MSWIIRVVGPAGLEMYLSKDRLEVENSKDAQRFEDPNEAQAAADAYLDIARKCWPCPPYVGIEDENAEG